MRENPGEASVLRVPGMAVEQSVEFALPFRFTRTVSEPAADSISDDAALVAAARSGDRAAFGQLYERYARMVHGILLARVPSQEADDLVHDVFLQALRHLHTLRDAGAFGGWLCRITRNRATDYHRRRPASDELPEELPGRPGPDPAALAALKVIKDLPEAYRETLILRLVEGFTGPEIAARTGLKPASVRVNLHRGIKQLREILSKDVRP